MNRNTALNKMREAYHEGDIKRLSRLFVISQWLLTDDDKAKIKMAIDRLIAKRGSYHPKVLEALDILGGHVVEK